MNKKEVLTALSFAREMSKKRKFVQSVEYLVNFKGIDFKKAENRIDLEVRLPHQTGKQSNVKVCVFVKDANFAQEIKGKASRVIMDAEIPQLKKKDVDLLIKDYDVFLAEGASILAVAKHLGQQLAPKGKMPKPIAASFPAFEQSLRSASTFTKITNKKGKFMPVIHIMVGKESFKDDQIAENILEIYNSLMNVVPAKEGSIKSQFVKLSMGLPIKIGQKYEASSAQWNASKPAEGSK